MTWLTRIKRLACRLAVNVTCSSALGRDLELPYEVIPNPYDDGLFKARPDVFRNRDLLFVGRLVSDKGADLLLEAVAQMAATGVCLTTTITGSGPEEDALKSQVAALGLTEQVRFTGPLSGETLARMMNAHRVLVVPSRWEEPFGIVALEGLASGCNVVASDGGGLGEAVGPCGLLFHRNSVVALKEAILMSIQINFSPELRERHLAWHRASSVAERFEKIINWTHTRQPAFDSK